MFQKIFITLFILLPMTVQADLRLLEPTKIKKNHIGSCLIYQTDAQGKNKTLVKSYHFDSEGYPIFIHSFSGTNTNTVIFAYRFAYYGNEKKVKERYRLDVKPIMIENFIYADPFTTYITRDNGLEKSWTNAKMNQIGNKPLLEKFHEPTRDVTVSYAYSSSNKIIDWRDSLLHREVYLFDKKGSPFSHTIFLRGTEEPVNTLTFENDPSTGLPVKINLHNDKDKLIGIQFLEYAPLSNTITISGKIAKGKCKDGIVRIRHGFTLENEKAQTVSPDGTFSFDLPIDEPGIYDILTSSYHSVSVAVYPKDKIFVIIDAKDNKIIKVLGSDQTLKIQKMEKEMSRFIRTSRHINQYDISNWILFKLKDQSPSLVHLRFLDRILITKNNLTSIEAMISQLLKKYPRNIKLHTFIRENNLDTVK